MKRWGYCIGLAVLGFGILQLSGMNGTKKKLEDQKKMTEKNREQYLLLNQWLKLRQSGKSICNYLSEKGYKTVAIYGMGINGKRVIQELKDSEIEVLYGIDKKADSIVSEINVLAADADLPETDAIVVSEPIYIEEITKLLKTKVHCPIVSLEEAIYESF